MKTSITSVLLLAPLALAVSTFPNYPTRNGKECSVSVENSGVTIGLEPVEDVTQQMKYFGAKLAKKGFIPVLVVIENRMDSNSVIFDKSKVTLGPAESTIPAAKTGSGEGKAMAVGFFPFFGGFAAAQEISDASHIQTNLVMKELQSTTISAGASVQGFLYIPATTKHGRQKISVRIPVAKAGTGEVINFDLVF